MLLEKNADYERDTIARAVAKLGEKKQKEGAKSRVATAVYSAVIATLKDFCSQSLEFAEAVLQTDRTAGECCEQLSKGVGSSISDIEVCRRVAEFYFPGSKVEFQVKLYMCEDEKNQPEPEQRTAVVLNLFDML